MLRVSSILYLQNVWTHPVRKPAVIIRAPSPTNSTFSVEQINIDINSIGSEVETTEQSSCYGTVDIVSIQEGRRLSKEEQALLKIEEDLLRKERKREQERKRIEEEQWQVEQERQKNEKRLKELLRKQKEKQRLQEKQIDEQLHQERLRNEQHVQQEEQKKRQEQEEENYSTPSTPTPSTTMDDLSCSNSSINLNDKQISCLPFETPIHPYSPAISTRDRDYYDDNLSSDNEQIIDQLPTPPSTPNKFSPKRILHRAKSSINDESVRSLGRRTSQFLEKKLLSPTTTTPDEFSIKGLRRQSSKLSVKGKTFGKKLKRVLSFQQTS